MRGDTVLRKTHERLPMSRMFRILFVLVSFVHCGDAPLAPDEAIIGTWKLTLARNESVTVNYILTFESNGNYTFINTIFDGSQITTTGIWRIQNNTLFLDTLDFGFSIEEDVLTLYAIDGTVFVYTKQ